MILIKVAKTLDYQSAAKGNDSRHLYPAVERSVCSP